MENRIINKNISQRWARTEWFRHSRFGMFIHWGLYAIPSRGEWVRSVEKMPLRKITGSFLTSSKPKNIIQKNGLLSPKKPE